MLKTSYKDITLKILIVLLFFYVFNLEVVDKEGFERFDAFSNSKIFRIAWLSAIIITIIPLIDFRIFIKKQNIKLFVYSFLLISSILLSSYGNNSIAYYRWLELFFVIVGAMTVIKYIEKNKKFNLDIFIQKAILFNYLIILIVLLAFTIFKPEMAYQLESQDRLRLGGSLYSPNLLGIILILSATSSLVIFKRKILIFSILLLTSILIYLTDSRTSLLIYVFCISLLLWKKNIFSKAIILFSFSILFMFLMEVLISSMDKAGDMSTMNNRLPIYETIIEGIKTHPLTGLGYVEGVRYYLDQNFTQSFWKPSHTHNSYLETLSSIGIIFGSLVLLYIFKILIYSIKVIATSKDNIETITSIQIIAILLGALTIPTFGNIVNPTFVFLIFFLSNKIERYHHEGSTMS